MSWKIGALIVAAVGFLATGALAADTPNIEWVDLPRDLQGNVDGAALYQGLCASCHGATGEGDGVAAGVVYPSPPDLTVLAAENGGEFPSRHVLHAISGRNHEMQEMPNWEQVLGGDRGEEEHARILVYRLTQHVKELQADAP